jgi:DinB superfamily
VAFDPVAEPDAYRRSLLMALGDQDPVVVLAAGPEAARSVAISAGSWLRAGPEPGEWSVLECIAHLADSELVTAARLRWIASEDEPDIVGYDQALWVSAMRQVEEDLDTLLGAFEAIRRWNLALWERLPLADRARFGIHRERGRESIDLLVRLQAGHDIVHLAQARRALETVRGAAAAN